MSSWSFLPDYDLAYIHISCSDDQLRSEMLTSKRQAKTLLLREGGSDAVI